MLWARPHATTGTESQDNVPREARARRTQPSRAVHTPGPGCGRRTAAVASRQGGKQDNVWQGSSGADGLCVRGNTCVSSSWEGVSGGEAGSAECGCRDHGRVALGRGHVEPHGCHGLDHAEEGHDCPGWYAGKPVGASRTRRAVRRRPGDRPKAARGGPVAPRLRAAPLAPGASSSCPREAQETGHGSQEGASAPGESVESPGSLTHGLGSGPSVPQAYPR